MIVKKDKLALLLYGRTGSGIKKHKGCAKPLQIKVASGSWE